MLPPPPAATVPSPLGRPLPEPPAAAPVSIPAPLPPTTPAASASSVVHDETIDVFTDDFFV